MTEAIDPAAAAIDDLYEAWEEGRAYSPDCSDIVQAWASARGIAWNSRTPEYWEGLADLVFYIQERDAVSNGAGLVAILDCLVGS